MIDLMLLSSSLDAIAEKCKELILGNNEQSIYDEGVIFIQREIEKDVFLPSLNYEILLEGNKKNSTATINKIAFLESEIDGFERLLYDIFYNNGQFSIRENIEKLILVGVSKEQVYMLYARLYNYDSMSLFVKVVYSYDIIKYLLFVRNQLAEIITPRQYKVSAQVKKSKARSKEIPKTFEDLFHIASNAEPCLSVLRNIEPPVIDAANNYIGKAKGIWAVWIRELKKYDPPLIKHFDDDVYKDLLNLKINGLNLSKDASEFRKYYKRLENKKVYLDIKTLLSQLSQSGRLGK